MIWIWRLLSQLWNLLCDILRVPRLPPPPPVVISTSPPPAAQEKYEADVEEAHKKAAKARARLELLEGGKTEADAERLHEEMQNLLRGDE